jgi:hypothetical protein
MKQISRLMMTDGSFLPQADGLSCVKFGIAFSQSPAASASMVWSPDRTMPEFVASTSARSLEFLKKLGTMVIPLPWMFS